MKVETGHHIGIVERCSADLCTCQLHRVHIGYGGNCSGSSYLKDYLAKRRLCLLCLELVGDGPSGALGRHAEALLLGQ